MNRAMRAWIRGHLFDVHVVAEWREGAVYKTRKIGQVICTTQNQPLVYGGYLVPANQPQEI